MTTPTRNARWYHLTPDRFFLGLLVVQVFLLLSERFQWYWFNEKKGWTVLIAVGVVCVAVMVMLIWFLVAGNNLFHVATVFAEARDHSMSYSS